MLRTFLVTTLTLLFALGCASDSPTEGKRPNGAKGPQTDILAPPSPKGQDPEISPTPSPNAFILENRCANPGLQLFPSGPAELNGHLKTLLTPTREKISLCDALKATGAKTAIFQFAGVTCLECIETAKWLQSELRTPKYKEIAHVVVFTDFFEDEPERAFQDFMKSYAKDAHRVHDEAVLWKMLSKDPSSPDRATILAFSQSMSSHVLNEPGKNHEILDYAFQITPKATMEIER